MATSKCKSSRLYSVTSGLRGNDVQMAAVVTGAQPQKVAKPSSAISQEFVTETLNHLRSVLLSSKEGLTPKQILYDFIYFVGEAVPYMQLGYEDLVSFLDAQSDVCERVVENGRLVYLPKIDERCHHIWRLVHCQKSPTRRHRRQKRKSISVSEENAPPKRSKSDTRNPNDATSTPDAMTGGEFRIDVATSVNPLNPVNTSTPPDTNKSVHFETLIASAAQRPRRQRSRTRLHFFHKDDPGKPKFNAPRRRGRSMTSLHAATGEGKTPLPGVGAERDNVDAGKNAIHFKNATNSRNNRINGKKTARGRTTSNGQTVANGQKPVPRQSIVGDPNQIVDQIFVNDKRVYDRMSSAGQAVSNGATSGNIKDAVTNPSSRDHTFSNGQVPNNDVTPVNEVSAADEGTPTNDRASSNDSSSSASNSLDAVKWKAPFHRKPFYPGRTSTPRRSATEYLVPEDIRKNLVKILHSFPKGVFVHEIPDMYRKKCRRQLPLFLSSTNALTEIFTCLTPDVIVVNHECGSVTVKLRQFEKPTANVAPTNAISSAPTTKSPKCYIVETLIDILSRRHVRGIFLSRLRVEFFKETGEMIPVKRLGFVSERLFLASMPENFNLRPTTTEPGVEPEYIVSLASSSSV